MKVGPNAVLPLGTMLQSEPPTEAQDEFEGDEVDHPATPVGEWHTYSTYSHQMNTEATIFLMFSIA